MMLNSKRPLFFLTILPLLIGSRDPQSALLTAGVFSGFGILLGGFFLGTRKLFPRRLFKFSTVFCLAMLSQATYFLVELPPYWAISVFILFWMEPGVMVPDSGEKGKAPYFFMILIGAGFLIPAGFARRYFEQVLVWGLLQQAVFIYFFLMSIALLLERVFPAEAENHLKAGEVL